MFAQTDIFSLDKWVMVGKDLGIGAMFALVLLALGACGSFYILRAGFGKRGFVREFFDGVKNAAIEFFDRLTQTLDRLEAAAAESRDYHRQQAAVCRTMLDAHTDPAGPCNLAGIRAAAACGLDALESIGEQVGADVAKHVEAAKNKLIA
ncbi:MAG: hypothetical protein IT426_12050 [Pirellulales bacterium]|nr:hypothetical protein [Pirellulales bacterium]